MPLKLTNRCSFNCAANLYLQFWILSWRFLKYDFAKPHDKCYGATMKTSKNTQYLKCSLFKKKNKVLWQLLTTSFAPSMNLAFWVFTLGMTVLIFVVVAAVNTYTIRRNLRKKFILFQTAYLFVSWYVQMGAN